MASEEAEGQERRRRMAAMVEESEGVAMNIARAEEAVKVAGGGVRGGGGWMW